MKDYFRQEEYSFVKQKSHLSENFEEIAQLFAQGLSLISRLSRINHIFSSA